MRRASFVLLCILSVAGPAFAQQAIEARIDSLFAEWDRPDSPGAALAVIRGGEVVYAKGYGVANLEYGVPITPSSVFMVASVSKQFTAFAVAMLAEQGKLSLDADIRTYVPEMHDFGTPITARHLIHHTSGLRDEFDLLEMAGWRMDDVITREHILRLAYRQRALNFEPGSAYSYSNTGYTLLSEIVERVTGQPFRAWTTEHLFEPLGMAHSFVLDDYHEIVPNRAQGYRKEEDGTYKKQVLSYQSLGASGLHTTVLDMARWLRNLDEGTVGGPAVLHQVHQRGVLNNGDTLTYAFALDIGTHRGRKRVSHGGFHRGFRTIAVRFPDDDLGIALFSNLESFDPAVKALQVADLYLAETVGPLEAYTGAYRSEELATTYTLVAEGGRLVARHPRNPDIVLKPYARDYFESDTESFGTVQFTREGGRVVGFRVSTGRVRNLVFDRVDGPAQATEDG